MRLVSILALALALGISAAQAAERTKLTIYTALENDQLGPFKAAIEKAVPEAEVVWVRDSTGVITARFLAEKDNPRADMVIGLAASSLLMFETLNLLAPYKPAGADALKEAFRDPKPPYTWTGMDAYLGVVCFNTAEASRDGVKTPQRWDDLLQPGLKGKVVMPHPASSGTGYLMVAGWLQSMGEEKGWAFMDALHAQVDAYPPSGTAPCAEAGAGRKAAGLSFDMRAAAEKGGGAPIDIVVPVDGTGWDQEGLAIFAGSAHPDLARRVADWGVSREANQLYARTYAVVAYPGVSNPAPIYPPHAEARMIRIDLAWMARHRARIVAEWRRRYGDKAAP